MLAGLTGPARSRLLTGLKGPVLSLTSPRADWCGVSTSGLLIKGLPSWHRDLDPPFTLLVMALGLTSLEHSSFRHLVPSCVQACCDLNEGHVLAPTRSAMFLPMLRRCVYSLSSPPTYLLPPSSRPCRRCTRAMYSSRVLQTGAASL